MYFIGHHVFFLAESIMGSQHKGEIRYFSELDSLRGCSLLEMTGKIFEKINFSLSTKTHALIKRRTSLIIMLVLPDGDLIFYILRIC